MRNKTEDPRGSGGGEKRDVIREGEKSFETPNLGNQLRVAGGDGVGAGVTGGRAGERVLVGRALGII